MANFRFAIKREVTREGSYKSTIGLPSSLLSKIDAHSLVRKIQQLPKTKGTPSFQADTWAFDVVVTSSTPEGIEFGEQTVIQTYLATEAWIQNVPFIEVITVDPPSVSISPIIEARKG